MDKNSLYENMTMPDANFPIRLFKCDFEKSTQLFSNHWHEQIEFLYILKGNAGIQCNSNVFHVEPEDLVIINSNELHYDESLSSELSYYVIIIDISLLHSSSIDVIETKYITPITRSRILFSNKVTMDQSLLDCIKNMIYEYENKEMGYELAIKSYIYRLLLLLMRNQKSRILTVEEYISRVKNLESFKKVLKYIDEYFLEDINLNQLSKMMNVCDSHFCRAFKTLTGKTLSDYINRLRIVKAENLLVNSDMNISEVAMNVGFNDINYFSRLFRKYKKVSPTEYRNRKS